MAKIEFYVGRSAKFIASLEDYAVPRVDEFVNINKIVYQVMHVTWAVDYTDSLMKTLLRANVELKKA